VAQNKPSRRQFCLSAARTGAAETVGMPKPDMLHPIPAILVEMIRVGRLVPVIDRVCPFTDLIGLPRYLETGHKRGNPIVI
ncbi:MAG: hypothetical protein KDJ66_03800, partial [Nitratireductor sp.]|nr:hypothetical protein [Nitratireductor sp.]